MRLCFPSKQIDPKTNMFLYPHKYLYENYEAKILIIRIFYFLFFDRKSLLKKGEKYKKWISNSQTERKTRTKNNKTPRKPSYLRSKRFSIPLQLRQTYPSKETINLKPK